MDYGIHCAGFSSSSILFVAQEIQNKKVSSDGIEGEKKKLPSLIVLSFEDSLLDLGLSNKCCESRIQKRKDKSITKLLVFFVCICLFFLFLSVFQIFVVASFFISNQIARPVAYKP